MTPGQAPRPRGGPATAQGQTAGQTVLLDDQWPLANSPAERILV